MVVADQLLCIAVRAAPDVEHTDVDIPDIGYSCVAHYR